MFSWRSLLRWIRAGRLASLSALLMLGACQTTLAPPMTLSSEQIKAVGQAPFCGNAEPFFYSRRDTLPTQNQAREHNAVGTVLCGWGKKG